jgi:hypothetical protein
VVHAKQRPRAGFSQTFQAYIAFLDTFRELHSSSWCKHICCCWIRIDNEKLDLFHEDQLERIAWYIEAQYQNIVHDLPAELYQKVWIAWVDLPDFSNLQNGDAKKHCQ